MQRVTTCVLLAAAGKGSGARWKYACRKALAHVQLLKHLTCCLLLLFKLLLCQSRLLSFHIPIQCHHRACHFCTPFTAAGTMGSMDLQGLGSSDMEQLLQGVAIQDLVGNQLLMSGSMEGGMGGMAGPQGALLRLMEAPGLLQQMFAGLQDPAAAGQQQEAQEQPDGTQQQQQQQAQSAAEEQEAAGEGRLQQQQWEAGDQPEAEADDASGYS